MAAARRSTWQFLVHIVIASGLAAGCAPAGPAAPPDPPATRAQAAPTVWPPPPSPTILPSATPLPTDTPHGRIGPLSFPPDVNPLTGERTDAASLERLPLAVKISNAPACVRPQAGLSDADLVFEHFAEGGTTRFTAIFYGRDPGRVGSVRSARFIDLELPAMYDAVFAYAGASIGVSERLGASDFRDRILTPSEGCPPFCRAPIAATACGLLEHTLFSDTGDLWAVAAAQGLAHRPSLGGMAFHPDAPREGEPANRVTLTYTGSFVEWRYDPGLGSYYRWQDGGPHVDANNQVSITADNVVIVFVHHVITDVIEDKVGYDPSTGAGGNYSVQIQLWGRGPAVLFRDGRAQRVTWVRLDRTGALGLVTDADYHVHFKPGNTWFQLVPLDSPMTVDGDRWRVDPTRLPRTPFGY